MLLEGQSDSFGSFSCHKSKGLPFHIVKLVHYESPSVLVLTKFWTKGVSFGPSNEMLNIRLSLL